VLARLGQPCLETVGLQRSDLAVEAIEEGDVARASSAICVQRKMRMSSSGTARMIGPSSAATRCSPTKNKLSPYIRAPRCSASMRSCQSTRSCVKSMSCTAHGWRSHSW
jgi:hypothetical protein